MCVPEKNPYNPIRTMYSCETLDCLGVHVCSDIDTEARSERALINVKKSPIFKTSDACRRVMLLRERVGERVLPEESALAVPPPPPPPPPPSTSASSSSRALSPSLSLSLSRPLLHSTTLSLPRAPDPPCFFSLPALAFSLCRPSPPPPLFDERVLSKQRERLCPLVPAVKSWAYFKFAAFYRIRYLSTGCTSSKGRPSLPRPPPPPRPPASPDKTPVPAGCTARYRLAIIACMIFVV